MTEECEECGKEFDSKRGLHIHEAQVHEEENEDTFKDDESSSPSLNLNIKQVGYASFLIGLLTGLLLGSIVFGFAGLDGSIDEGPPEDDSSSAIDVESYDAGLGSAEDGFDWEGGNVDLEDRPYLGDSDAEVTIVSFEDFSCIWCSRHNTERAFPDLLENEIADGDVQYFYRHFPRTPVGEDTAEVSECVLEQDVEKFWQVKEHFYENHRSITQGDEDEVIDEALNGLEIDRDEFDSCMDDGAAEEKVTADHDEASNYDYTYTQNGEERQFVAATPSFLIYNHETGEAHAEAGALPYEEFQDYINQ